jgi:hypothetical protein
MTKPFRKRIRVIDISKSASAEQAEEMLNAPYEEGFYMTTMYISPAEGMWLRAFFKLRVKDDPNG